MSEINKEKTPKIVIERADDGTTKIQIFSAEKDDVPKLLCEAVTESVERQLCPPDLLTRAVTRGIMNASGKVPLSEKANKPFYKIMFWLENIAPIIVTILSLLLAVGFFVKGVTSGITLDILAGVMFVLLPLCILHVTYHA